MCIAVPKTPAVALNRVQSKGVYLVQAATTYLCRPVSPGRLRVRRAALPEPCGSAPSMETRQSWNNGMQELPQWIFDVYALALPRGHGFGDRPPTGAWGTADGLACGTVTQDVNDGSFGILVMRRRVDHAWTVTAQDHGFASKAEALARMELHLREGEPTEPIPPAIARRPALYDLRGRMASDIFKSLATPSRYPAAWMLNQLYLALPKPDRNWAGDCQTVNFHTRLWEAQLLASFREQGLLVTQPYEAPDFRIQNRFGGEAWVEAVTANPTIPYNHAYTRPTGPPQIPEDLFFGPTALRFARTLGNKIGRCYDRLPHVVGKPFMIAIADFQAPASMIWSREGLIGYLYGVGAKVVEVDGRRRAVRVPAPHRLSASALRPGLFANEQHAELSAVIFSNACSIAKLYRVAVSGGGAPKGFRYMRIGTFSYSGAFGGVSFCLDVTSAEYRRLWPQRYEPWSAELEVFHNPYARHPAPFELVPEATHWFRQSGEVTCSAFYERSIWWSLTRILKDSDPIPQVEGGGFAATEDMTHDRRN